MQRLFLAANETSTINEHRLWALDTNPKKKTRRGPFNKKKKKNQFPLQHWMSEYVACVPVDSSTRAHLPHWHENIVFIGCRTDKRVVMAVGGCGERGRRWGVFLFPLLWSTTGAALSEGECRIVKHVPPYILSYERTGKKNMKIVRLFSCQWIQMYCSAVHTRTAHSDAKPFILVDSIYFDIYGNYARSEFGGALTVS